MNNILALDQASRVSGYAIFKDGQLISSGTFSVTDQEIGQRLLNIRNKVQSLISEYEITEIVLEDIQMQGQTNNVQTHKVLAEVLGVLEELAAELKIPHTVVHATTWRSVVGIKGRARAEQKKNAQLFVEQTYNKSVSQDEADAICIGTYSILQSKKNFNWD